MTLPSLPFRSLTLFLLALLASGAPAQAAGPHAPAGVEIEADGPKGPLKGILLQPQASSSMVVLIIPGSGPTNRNGNGPNGLRASTYRLLAEALAEGGLSSVRVDKRGLFSSKAAVDDPNDVTLNAYATDVHAWVGAIRKKTGADCVWVLGHSEGGLVALTAARQPAGICGLILVATPGRRLAEVLREQLQANPANAPLLEQAMSAIGSLERGKRIDVTGMQAALLPLFRPAVQGFLIDLFNADPVALAQQVRLPALVVQGLEDLQVTEGDARLLADALTKGCLVLLPGVNHVLKFVGTGDEAANRAAYGDAGLPLAPGMADEIAAFIRSSPASDGESSRCPAVWPGGSPGAPARP